MTFLPIVTRELLVASRRPLTFRIRRNAAVLGAAATLIYLVGHAGRPSGTELLGWLGAMAFVCTAISGVFLTADSISQERREGTLGLLFLTGLRGYDVIFGKLLVTGLNALMALGAILPILAFAWILGGVGLGEFWRLALALLNTLWVSLAIGMLCSACHRSQKGALTTTFLVVGIWIFGLGLLHSHLHAIGGHALSKSFCRISPMVSETFAWDQRYRTDPDAFPESLQHAHWGGWIILIVGCVLVPRVQMTPAAAGKIVDSSTSHLKLSTFGSKWNFVGKRLSSELLDDNPVFALLATTPSEANWVWLPVALSVLVVVGNILLKGPPALPIGFGFLSSGGMGPTATTLLVTGILASAKMIYAWHACDFFAAGRRQQALESLLTTPLSNRTLLNGLHRAQRKKFAVPMTVLGITLTVGTLFQTAVAAAGPAGAFSTAGLWGAWLYTMITLPIDLSAISWLGILLSLRDARPEWAFARTVGFVVVLPLVFFFLPSALVTGAILGYAQNRLRQPIRQILEGNPQSASRR